MVFEGSTEKGLPVRIRYVKEVDAPLMCEFINTLSQEQTFISFQGEVISLDHEIEYVKDVLEKFKKNLTIHLLVFSEDRLIGSSDLGIKRKVRAVEHEGVFGISILKEYRGKGLGKLLMKLVLDEAAKNIPELRIVTLSVFGDNPLAMEMYKKFGFVEFGRLPEGVLHKGKYLDHILMYKKVK